MDIKEVRDVRETEINEAHHVAYNNILSVLYENYLELIDHGNDSNAELTSTNNSPAILPRIE